MVLPGYRDPRTYMPEGKYPDDWPPFERIHPPDWRSFKIPNPPEWTNATEYVLDRHIGTPVEKKTALIADDVKYTYRDVLEQVCKAANAMTKTFNLDYDNRVLIVAPDYIEALVTWLGAQRAGITPCWVSHLYKSHDIKYFIEDTACKVLFIDGKQAEKVNEIRHELPPTLKHIVVYRADGNLSWARDYQELVGNMPGEFQPLKKHVDDFTYLFYSGGTTGRPKCIIHLVRDFTWIPYAFVNYMEWRPDDIHYDTSPKFHDHGIWPGAMIPMWNGATAILVSEPLTPKLVVDVIEKHKPTILTTVPTVLKWLVAFPEEYGRKPSFQSIRMVHSAAEQIPMVIHQKFLEIYGIEIFDSIGCSEVSYEWFANRPKEHKMGSTGKPIFGYEALLVDPNTFEIIREPNKEGEMWVKADSVLAFYWRKYHKSKDVLIGPWFRTGDVMYFDEEGFLWHVSRLDDVFKSHGMWVSPLEVEGVIMQHHAVKEAAVVPKKDDADGLTYPKAFVVLKSGYTLTPAMVKEIQELVRKSIGGYKVPKWIEQIDEIPRTTFQKISRVTLRKLEEERQKPS
ncbi:MAG: AMP-binding protein [Aigarchaeota archaeon]|nr:AMP-binding protein [Aigarchaeota archaeon]MDW8092876.1 AMP-binding protein [Nitrososphaerota archaeon]